MALNKTRASQVRGGILLESQRLSVFESEGISYQNRRFGRYIAKGDRYEADDGRYRAGVGRYLVRFGRYLKKNPIQKRRAHLPELKMTFRLAGIIKKLAE
ncbi:hypothetical protein D1970_19700 [Mesobacillus zeae]|uniref:Uncharacterized protein n=1 Tax=Mesobacillus zeae TaxID=1917180 RepID=A0A398AX78_9BACI|nr:hypothetical protein D1970_19700 [Mesobacillus zeae]